MSFPYDYRLVDEVYIVELWFIVIYFSVSLVLLFVHNTVLLIAIAYI